MLQPIIKTTQVMTPGLPGTAEAEVGGSARGKACYPWGDLRYHPGPCASLSWVGLSWVPDRTGLQSPASPVG